MLSINLEEEIIRETKVCNTAAARQTNEFGCLLAVKSCAK